MTSSICCRPVDFIKETTPFLAGGLAFGMTVAAALSTTVIVELALMILAILPIWLAVASWSLRNSDITDLTSYKNILREAFLITWWVVPIAMFAMTVEVLL